MSGNTDYVPGSATATNGLASPLERGEAPHAGGLADMSARRPTPVAFSRGAAAHGNGATLAELHDVRLAIGATPVLKGVSLTLRAGEIYGLLGPNGAGKSTTIAAALGLLKPQAGTVRLFGCDPRAEGPSLRRRVGVLPERSGCYEWMSAERYLSFYGRLYGRALSAGEVASRLATVGLVTRPGQQIGTFSRGMQQRLALARALVADPQLIVLDEPTHGLDPRSRRTVHDILLALAADGAAILLCTHLLDDVERLCAEVGFIVDGRTVHQGRMAQLLAERGRVRQFRLRLDGPPPDNAIAGSAIRRVSGGGDWMVVEVDPACRPEDAWRELMFRGWPIVEIERTQGGLESLYLDLTATVDGTHDVRRRAQ